MNYFDSKVANYFNRLVYVRITGALHRHEQKKPRGV